MTDKELIELAAEAVKLPEAGWMGPSFCYVKDNTFTEWSPLENEGDNHRLAAALGISVIISPTAVLASFYATNSAREEFDHPGSITLRFDMAQHGLAEYATPEEKPAAVRRAVVLAAAATQAPLRRVAV